MCKSKWSLTGSSNLVGHNEAGSWARATLALTPGALADLPAVDVTDICCALFYCRAENCRYMKCGDTKYFSKMK